MGRFKWRPFEKLCAALALFAMILVIRPQFLSNVIQYIPLVKSLRWPFRESLQFLFFIHLLIILRPQPPQLLTRRFIAAYSLALFLLPLPFLRVPTFNALAIDRKATLNGNAERYWSQVKPLLQPTDHIATVIDWNVWQAHAAVIPYTYLGTADFPELFRLPCASGYSPVAPLDQTLLKTVPYYWFGAFNVTQVSDILRERPDLKLIVLDSAVPLKISLRSQGHEPIDLTPFLPQK
jgi:hypothetical protein